MLGPSPTIAAPPASILLRNCARSAHRERQAAVELAVPDSIQPLANAALDALHSPRRLPDQHARRRVPDIEIAGPVLLPEVQRVEHAAAGDQRRLVGIPVHGMRRTCSGHGNRSPPRSTRDPQHRGLIGGIGAAHQLRDLLILRIQPPAVPVLEPGSRPRRVKRHRDLRRLDRSRVQAHPPRAYVIVRGFVAGSKFVSIVTGSRRARLITALAATCTCPGSFSWTVTSAWWISGFLKVRRKLHRPGLHHASRLPGQHIRKRRSARRPPGYQSAA